MPLIIHLYVPTKVPYRSFLSEVAHCGGNAGCIQIPPAGKTTYTYCIPTFPHSFSILQHPSLLKSVLGKNILRVWRGRLGVDLSHQPASHPALGETSTFKRKTNQETCHQQPHSRTLSPFFFLIRSVLFFFFLVPFPAVSAIARHAPEAQMP